MRKSVTAVCLAVFLLTGCAAASDGASQNVEIKDNRTSVGTESDAEKSSVVDNRSQTDSASDIAVTDEEFEKTGYLYENSIGDSLYFYVVTNHSKAAVSIDGNATALDANENVIGADEGSIDIIGPEETSLIVFYFDSVQDIDSVECLLNYDTNTHYTPVLANLNLQQTINDKNLTVIAANNGTVSAQFVEAYALFFDADGNVVSYDSAYITDNDSEIKPGAELSVQLDAYEKFDHVECFLTGRSNGEASEADGSVADEDFAVKEYHYENTIGDSLYFLVITNNSTGSVGIDINMTAYDAGENVIGAANGSIDVLGPAEQSIASFYFDSVTGIDHVAYTMSYDDSPFYDPVLSDLDIVQNINDKNVVVSVTNKGSEPAQFVEVYALFLNSAEQVVSYESRYVTDSDSEIKPGAALSEQLDSYEPFDSVECYFTGRKGGF